MAAINLGDTNQNKLGLVNRCLQAIGEAPLPPGTIPSEFPLGSDTQIASSIVDDTWLEVLNRGWWFNTHLNFSMLPDIDGFIAFPSSLLRIDSNTTRGRYIKKNGLLYDRIENTFIFDKAVILDVVWLTGYSDLPISAYEYIATRAARKYQQKVIGAAEMATPLMQEEGDALINLQRENSQYLDVSLLDSNVSNRYINPRR
jgi:hypothetical protein